MKYTIAASKMQITANNIQIEKGMKPVDINFIIEVGAQTADFTATDVIQIMAKRFTQFVQLFVGFVKFQRIMRTELVEWVDTAIANAPKVIAFMNNPMGEETKAEDKE